MYKLIIITAIGNYAVEMTPEKENPDNNDLIKMFIETTNEVEAGCFMEGWTPNDKPGSPPGVFALAKGLDILAYHVERVEDIKVPVSEEHDTRRVLPLSIPIQYLGNTLTAKCVVKLIRDVHVIVCYEVNGEPPTDVLDVGKLSEHMNSYILFTLYDEGEYLLQITEDEKIRNFSQAVEVLEKLEEDFNQLQKEKTGKAWTGWKGDDE